jgi:hypothetical protein
LSRFLFEDSWGQLFERAVCCPVKARKSLARLASAHSTTVSWLTMFLSLLLLHACFQHERVPQPLLATPGSSVVVCSPSNGILVCSDAHFTPAGHVVVSQQHHTAAYSLEDREFGDVSGAVLKPSRELDSNTMLPSIGFSGVLIGQQLALPSSGLSSVELSAQNASFCAPFRDSSLDFGVK